MPDKIRKAIKSRAEAIKAGNIARKKKLKRQLAAKVAEMKKSEIARLPILQQKYTQYLNKRKTEVQKIRKEQVKNEIEIKRIWKRLDAYLRDRANVPYYKGKGKEIAEQRARYEAEMKKYAEKNKKLEAKLKKFDKTGSEIKTEIKEYSHKRFQRHLCR